MGEALLLSWLPISIDGCCCLLRGRGTGRWLQGGVVKPIQCYCCHKQQQQPALLGSQESKTRNHCGLIYKAFCRASTFHICREGLNCLAPPQWSYLGLLILPSLITLWGCLESSSLFVLCYECPLSSYYRQTEVLGRNPTDFANIN